MMLAPMTRWLRSPRRENAAPPIGVDFGSSSLHMVQCVRGTDGIAIRAAASVPYPVEWDKLRADGKMLRRFVRSALESAPFEGRSVYSAMPASQVRIVSLSVNVANGADEASAVVRALQEKLRSDLAGDVVDYLRVRGLDSGDTEVNVLAAVAAREKVLAHLRQLELAGLEPVALDVGPAALARLLGGMQQDDHEQSALLVNFGARHSYITVVSGRRLVMDREVEFGELLLAEKLAARLQVQQTIALSMLQKHGMASADAGTGQEKELGRTIHEILYPEYSLLAEEISRTMIYIASKTRGRTPQHLYLNGSLARYPETMARMQRMIDIPTSLLDPFSVLPASSDKAFLPGLDPAGGIALATGLALRE